MRVNDKPNFVFILTDDQGAWALGKETPEIITPNLDQMIDEGTYFTNFFCASPVCSPARCSIVTGRIPSAHGVHDWLRGGNVESSMLPEHMRQNMKEEHHAIDYLKGMPSCFDALRNAGYRLGMVGKWHMGDSMTPREGFVEWNTHLLGGGHYKHAPVYANGTAEYVDQYITDYFSDHAVSFIDHHPQEPFLLSVHYTAPHTPWAHEQHREDILKMYDDCPFNEIPFTPLHPDQITSCEQGRTDEERRRLLKGYYAAITAVDEGVGRIFDALRRNGLDENTVVIFSGDNGMNLGQHGVWGKGNGTYPMNMYDTSVKVPFIVWGPKYIRSGARVENLISHYDILPTLRDFLGQPTAPEEKLPGESFLKELTEGLAPHDRTLCIMDEYGPVRMVRNRTHKLVYEGIRSKHQLYDLVHDPNETTNHFGESEYAHIQAALWETLERAFEAFALDPFDGKELDPNGRGQMDAITSENKQVFCKK